VCSLCSAFGAAFAKLLWLFVVIVISVCLLLQIEEARISVSSQGQRSTTQRVSWTKDDLSTIDLVNTYARVISIIIVISVIIVIAINVIIVIIAIGVISVITISIVIAIGVIIMYFYIHNLI